MNEHWTLTGAWCKLVIDYTCLSYYCKPATPDVRVPCACWPAALEAVASGLLSCFILSSLCSKNALMWVGNAHAIHPMQGKNGTPEKSNL